MSTSYSLDPGPGPYMAPASTKSLAFSPVPKGLSLGCRSVGGYRVQDFPVIHALFLIPAPHLICPCRPASKESLDSGALAGIGVPSFLPHKLVGAPGASRLYFMNVEEVGRGGCCRVPA